MCHTRSPSVTRVLVLDDDSDVRITVTDILLSEGHAVVAARTCDEALRCVIAAPPDVILLDLRMEEGADGVEFARRYRALPPPHAAVVLFTALPDAPQIAAQIGAAALLSKPFHVRELLRIVEQLGAAVGRRLSA